MEDGILNIRFKKLVAITLFREYSLGTIIIVTFLFFLQIGCIEKPLDKAGRLVEIAISEFDKNSEEWQNIISRLSKELPKEASDIIGNDVRILSNNIIGATGAEFKCNVDFFRSRFRKDLINLKAKLFGEPLGITSPEFCTVSLPAINLNKSPEDQYEATIYGYDFKPNEKKLVAVMIDQNGKKTKLEDYRIVANTNYMLTLNITNLSKTLYKKKTSEILLTIDAKGSNNCKIAILEWVGKSEAAPSFQPNGITFIPPNKNIDRAPKGNNFRLYRNTKLKIPIFCKGDEDYSIKGDEDWDTGGNDPTKISLRTQLRKNKNRIEARLYIKAVETKGDKTGICGWLDWQTIYSAPENYEIESYTPNVNTMKKFEINLRGSKTIEMGGENVASYVIYLDSKESNDRGSYTRVKVEWNPLSVKQRKIKPNF